MIAAIEDAILARIAAVAGSGEGKLGYPIPTIRSYGAELDELVKTTVITYPAVFVALSGDDLVHDQGDTQIRKAEYSVIVAARSLRNEQARRHGAAGEIGAYQLLLDCRGLLNGQTFGLRIDPLAVTKIQALHHGVLRGQPVAVYAMDLFTAYVAPVAADAGRQPPTDHLSTIVTTWAGAGIGATATSLEQP